MYFIMQASDFRTVATTYHKDVADWIAANWKEPCIIRWAGNGD
jgi:hypothetical protein